MLYTITLCHANPKILEFGLGRYYETTCLPTTHILVDHHYPLRPLETSKAILDLAEKYAATVIRPIRNKGLAGGFNWALSQLELTDADFIIGFDPDSNPITPGWDSAMMRALNTYPELASISLMFDRIKNKPWRQIKETDASVLMSDTFQFFNVSMTPASFYRKTGGIIGRGDYGNIEDKMFELERGLNLCHGYLADYFEAPCPLLHDPEYHGWKMSHAHGLPDSFQEYCLKRTGKN